MAEKNEMVHPSFEKKDEHEIEIIKRCAENFLKRALFEKQPVISGSESALYQCFSYEVPHHQNSKIKNIRCTCFYRKNHHSSEGDRDQILFVYQDKFSEECIAEMHLGIIDSGTFLLEHRYVKPPFRTKKGIGTQLLTVAEQWVQEVAHIKKEETRIVVKTGQLSIIRWLEKQGYTVHEESRNLLEEIKHEPSNFFEDSVTLSQDSANAGIKKDPYLFRKGAEGRYMEDAVRLRFEKKFLPK